ncbi:hypothetical protein QWT87_20365 [Chryseobacterium sp. APV1]|uniref:Cbb3-type cytochrome c oxidase subunit 3 n=1 Tax=Chryseobacterium urinae TaxID=3058400 RepID=A0ABT8UCP2_9FLAO|nr:hypothetical protein [Chryseobacterium sp. APV1]MDO3427239.1 hypothetical protein [Chryseobacterium sp. APV1]
MKVLQSKISVWGILTLLIVVIFLISIAIRKDSVKTRVEKPKVDYEELDKTLFGTTENN